MDFFVENINYLTHANLSSLNIVLPLGISFFTFTQIAFLVDCYRGLVKQFRLLHYGLFVTYFPHLVAGPIIHHKEVMPQFDKNRTFHFNYRNFLLGTSIFAIGLFKKTVLADYLGALANPIFDGYLPHISTLDAWVAALSYTFEIYFDFSGYSDMAIGLSLLIGVKLPVNFYSPYKSVDIIEFWRRWNMTLSRFLRDYLYIPLGGNRNGFCRRYLNLIITMVLGGLWHGASWTFVLWGFLHGFYLTINHAWRALKKYLNIQSNNGFLFNFFSGMITFLAVVIAWVIFRAPNFLVAREILEAMFGQVFMLPNFWHSEAVIKIFLQNFYNAFTSESSLLGWIVTHTSFILIVVSMAIIWLLPNSYQFFRKYSPAFLPYQLQYLTVSKGLLWKPRLVWNYFIVLALVIGIIHIQASSIFLYFRF